MRLRELVAAALDEDVGPGDLTTELTVPADLEGSATVRAKEELVVCGHEAAAAVFEHLGGATYEALVPDGMSVERGTHVSRVSGRVRSLLTGERTALNLLMRLSGIATNTRRHVEAAGGRLKVVDTRKTTPLHRALEKHAVRCGGGGNHRFALYDGVLIKDNHVAAAGGITAAVERARAAHHLLRVEVEVSTHEQIREALAAGADALLLDNLDDAALADAVGVARAIRPRVLLEASGNMTISRITALRDHGLDLVSVGGLVHQARWADLSMKLDG